MTSACTNTSVQTLKMARINIPSLVITVCLAVIVVISILYTKQILLTSEFVFITIICSGIATTSCITYCIAEFFKYQRETRPAHTQVIPVPVPVPVIAYPKTFNASIEEQQSSINIGKGSDEELVIIINPQFEET